MPIKGRAVGEAVKDLLSGKVKCKDLRCEADVVEYGYKFHMNDVTATIGIEQLKYAGKTIHKHYQCSGRI